MVNSLGKKRGFHGRKTSGVHDALSSGERKFLDTAVKTLIQRAAKVAQSSRAPLLQFRLSKLRLL